MRQSILISLLALLYTHSTYAQSTNEVRVDDGTVDGSFIRPYQANWNSYSIDSTGVRSLGRKVIERIDTLSINGRRAIKFAQEWYAADGTFQYVNTSVADHETLGLLKFDSKSPIGGMGHVDFDGVHATGFAAYAPEADHSVIDTVMSEVPFGRGLAGLLVAAFPLADDYSATFPIMSWGGACNQPCSTSFGLEVTGSEVIDVAGYGEMDAWIVQMTSGVTYWVSRYSPYLLQARITRSNGTEVFFELLSE